VSIIIKQFIKTSRICNIGKFFCILFSSQDSNPGPKLRRARWAKALPPWQQSCPPAVFWIVINFIMFGIILPLQTLVCRLPPSPLKYFCPTMVCLVAALLKSKQNCGLYRQFHNGKIVFDKQNFWASLHLLEKWRHFVSPKTLMCFIFRQLCS